jgi:hypothetical protein
MDDKLLEDRGGPGAVAHACNPSHLGGRDRIEAQGWTRWLELLGRQR